MAPEGLQCSHLSWSPGLTPHSVTLATTDSPHDPFSPQAFLWL